MKYPTVIMVCHENLRLQPPTAPPLYLEKISISASEDEEGISQDEFASKDLKGLYRALDLLPLIRIIFGAFLSRKINVNKSPYGKYL